MNTHVSVMPASTGPVAGPSPANGVPVLSVENLQVEFVSGRGRLRAVDGVSFDVRRGEVLAIVGESGCGKSVTSLAVMRLLPRPAGRIVGGRILFEGRDLLGLDEEAMRKIRGKQIAMIFQEPMSSLNPVLTIGEQIMEPLRIHMSLYGAAARARAAELLGLVGMTDPERRLDQYPHHLSGGMRQRVMIAIGLSCQPKLIIADEPTTALDVTIQAQILELMKDLARRFDIAFIMITHNLGIVARYADRVQVMYAARAVERGEADDVFFRPRHPYTVGLLRSVPRLDQPRRQKLETIDGLPPNLAEPPSGCRFAPRCAMRADICRQDPRLIEVLPGHASACHRHGEIGLAEGVRPSGSDTLASGPSTVQNVRPRGSDTTSTTNHLLAVTHLKKFFSVPRGRLLGIGGTLEVRAVNDVSFAIKRGETLGLVGESGCGKTTAGRMVLGLLSATAGEIVLDGKRIQNLSQRELRGVRRKMQVVFQDPFSSLNPRMTIGDILAEPLKFYAITKPGEETRARVAALLQQVGLFPVMAERYPHEMSGGQRQRVGIARALAFEPTFIVCDEPVSALDVSIQGQIINLLEDLQSRLGLTYLFIAHDLAVVRHISDRVAVMYLGRIMELADRDAIYAEPLHPYTRALLDAAPVPDPRIEKARAPRALKGELPSPLNPPSGCVFHTRCPIATEDCRRIVPEPREVRPGHLVACLKV